MRNLLVLAAIVFVIGSARPAAAAVPLDALVKGSGPAIYYRAADGNRYVFPDPGTYFSWFTTFAPVQAVSDADLATVPLRGAVTYRPGIRLVKVTTDPKVYAVAPRGELRWVASEAIAAALYGPSWNRNVEDVPDAFFVNYTQGEPIASVTDFDPAAVAAAATTINRDLGVIESAGAPTSDTRPGADNALPDIAPLAPYDIRYTVADGRTQLKFTATFWNRGAGPLELRAEHYSDGDGDFPAVQRVFRRDGSSWDRPVGTLFWHSVHTHYHYDDFGEYRLEQLRSVDGQQAWATVYAGKTTFCLRDDMTINASTDGARSARTYYGCAGHTQGVSVGWADVYPYTLTDQYFDVTGLPAGTYRLTFRLDPETTFLESDRANNTALTVIEMDPAARTVAVIGKASPVLSGATFTAFPDGTLIRGETSGLSYLVYANKKRRVYSDAVLASYGLSVQDAFVLPDAAIDAMGDARFVRADGDTAIFMINDHGWKRKILGLEALVSYGAEPVADISVAELGSYQDTDLVVRQGEDRAYSIAQRRQVGTVASLSPGDLRSVHVISDADFASYAVSIAADGLVVPWDIAFLPDGDMLVTERPGTLRRIGNSPAVIDIPQVLHVGEGGLMGMALHPDFASNKLVYLYFTTAENGQRNRIARFRLEGASLVEDRAIMEDIPAALYHDGGQIAFGPDGMLYVSTGDANSPDLAQLPESLAGKTLRLTPDGGIPSDNPFGTAVWSLGHRNAQGIAWDHLGRMWQSEHGRSGAVSGYDELNLVERGRNYGWPTNQGDFVSDGMTGPVLHSTASVTWAPSGIAYLGGSLYFAGLRGQSLYEAVPRDDGSIAAFRAHLAGKYGRLRAVVAGPDGALYVSTSNRDGRGSPKPGDDKILRVYPGFLR